MSMERRIGEDTYHKGDKVIVREDLVALRSYRFHGFDSDVIFVSSMSKYKGQTVTIKSQPRPGHGYHIKEDGGLWNWSDDMFLGLASDIDLSPIDENDLMEVLLGC